MIYTTGTLEYKGETRQYLRIKSSEDIVLTGNYIQHIEELDDCTITYDFIIRDIIREEERGGYHYRWYVLESMNKVIDRTPKLKAEAEERQTANELAIAELAEAQTKDQTQNELALAELAEMIGGTN